MLLRSSHLRGLSFSLIAGGMLAAACGDDGAGGSGGQGAGPPEPMCGDAIPDPDLDEECDDGNLDEQDDCLNNCTLARCGDGVVRAGFEDCDDQNLDDTDACLSTCVTASCGDGFTQEGVEDCDDGNEEDGDACSSTCTSGTGCGNGTTEAGEECDDGNTSNADDCTNDCLAATCGDGHAQAGVEACDDGNNVDDDACSNACTVNTPTTLSCPGTLVDVSAGNDVTLGGDTAASSDNYDSQGVCGGNGGSGAPEVVYQLDVAQTGLLTLEMIAINDDLDPVLYVRQDCEGGPTIACADQTFQGGNESLTFAVQGGSTYFVFADGWDGSSGEFLLAATLLTQVPGDDCPGVNVPLFDVGDTSSVTGDTSAAEANRQGTGLCDSPATPEVVYRVAPSVNGKVYALLEPGAAYDASLYVRTTCTSSATQLVCAEAGNAGDDESVTVNVSAGQTYYFFVDGYDGSAGPYDITFELQPP